METKNSLSFARKAMIFIALLVVVGFTVLSITPASPAYAQASQPAAQPSLLDQLIDQVVGKVFTVKFQILDITVEDPAATPLAPASGTAIPTIQPTPGTLPTVQAPVDCGPWEMVDGYLNFKGNASQDVCQKDKDLETVRAGTPSKFTRSKEFTLAICAATVKNVDSNQAWSYSDCDQNMDVVYPAGTYQVFQPAGYGNGGYRATNK